MRVEAFVTGFTVVRLRVGVAVSVVGQRCLQCERLSAELTGVSLFLGVRPGVNFQRLPQFERLAARLTVVRPLVRVRHQMVLEFL